jgi:hypothetical protein
VLIIIDLLQVFGFLDLWRDDEAATSLRFLDGGLEEFELG